MPRTSRIWDYFAISEQDVAKAVCKSCKLTVSRGGQSASSFTTTNLKNHLRRYHATQYKELEEALATDKEAEKQKQAAEASTSTTQNAKRVGMAQLKIEQSLDKMKPW